MTDALEGDYGQLERREESVLLRFTRGFPHPARQVWAALTEPEHLRVWFPTTIEGERRSGAPLSFAHPDNAGPPFEGEMLVFESSTLMELRWGEDILRFELQPEGDGACLLIFTALFEGIGRAARDGAGWHACLDLLAHEVAGSPAPWTSAGRWRAVRQDYIERFGHEASTVGPPEEWE